ncbi:MAG: hypothetical protein NTU98_00315 [Bacteroidetes bacterium]|nr:hypothetical protein [Bacteroidota bacterium]
MKTKLLLAVLAIFLSAFYSCKKTENTGTPVASQTRIKSVTFADTSGAVIESALYAYDAHGRLATMSFTLYPLPSQGTMRFEYSANKVVRKGFTTGTSPVDILTYDMNSSGLAVKGVEVMYDSLGLSTGDSIFSTWQYDQAGYPIHHVQYQNPDSTGLLDYTYQISGGNTVSSTLQTGTYSTTFTYDYWPGSKNSISNLTMGQSFLGTPSANLLKSESVSGYPVMTYIYLFDSQGRVTKQMVQSTSGEVYFLSFTYY